MREPKPSRRTFVMSSAATLAAAATTQIDLAKNAYAGGSDTLRVGLVGAGGAARAPRSRRCRPTRTPSSSRWPTPSRIDLESSLETLKKSPVGDRVDVPSDRRYVGFDAYKNVIDQVDVVLLTTPPHFRPIHLGYAVEKGIHAFVEKPVATDAPGVRAVLQQCEDAKKKNLSIVSGPLLALPRAPARDHEARPRRRDRRHRRGRDDVQLRRGLGPEAHPRAGRLGDGVPDAQLVLLRLAQRRPHRRAGGPRHRHDGLGPRRRAPHPVLGLGRPAGPHRPEVWQHLRPLLGRLRVPQRRPGLPQLPPLARERAAGQGLRPRQQGDVRRLRQPDRPGRTSGAIAGRTTTCTRPSTTSSSRSIRSSKPINNGVYAARSTLLAIMARMAAYTGEVVTWEKALNSKEDLSPAKYAWGDAPVRPVPRPGSSKLA